MVSLLRRPKDNFYDRLQRSMILPAGIVEFCPDAMLVVDNRGHVAAWNKAMEKMTGVRASDMLGKGNHEYAIPFYGERKQMLVDLVGRPREEVSDRYTDVVVKDDHLEAMTIKAKLKGRDVTLWGVADRLYDLSGEPAGAIESIRDVTLQKLTEDRLKESEEKYRLIATSASDGIITVSPDGIITYINPSGEKMLHKGMKLIVGRHFTDFIADEYKEKAVKEFKRGMSGESIAPFEIEALDDAGRRLPIELSGGAMGSGENKSAIVAIRDVSERWKARMELKKARDELERRVEERTAELAKAKEQALLYLDLMGHDINNMNQVVMGYMEMAAPMNEGKASDLISRSLDVLRNSSRLIDNLRKVQQATGKQLKLEKVDLDDMLSQVKAEYSIVPGREVTIRYETSKAYVTANQLLRDVFSNIVGNAIKHSAGPAHVDIRLSEREERGKLYREVSIEDDGPGIPDSRKATIFSRADRASKSMGGGLGLYIVKALVEGFEGRVWVEDRVKGDYSKGCRFVVVLPAG